MIPIGDNIPSQRPAVVVKCLVATNICIFLFELLLMSGGQLEDFFRTFAIIPAREIGSLQQVLSGNIFVLPLLLLPILTAMFLHGGFFHIAGNMLFLWVFGDNIEDLMGHWRFLAFYLVCGFGASAAQILSDTSSLVPNLGASGAIAGVLGAYLINFPRARVEAILPLGFFWLPIQVPALFYLGFWFVQQTFYSIASLGVNSEMGSGGIAFLAHAGGFIFGVSLFKFFAIHKSSQALF
ncbi:rhomboid family intramembrane serine protease [Synechococcus sp. PCC 7336]|uniref:rhomboid family intramembrane serine protease n=1 Tax=Synechococcus sp. PCC 7336 TaxID=195250 RepID=UPI00034DA188|nr:rhomboid family intramembrane serine protease [Synechococcus sp. PCC 7336]